MNRCLNCGAETKNAKFCSISCQNKLQNKDKTNKRFGEFKEFTVKCERCGKDFVVEEREKLFPQRKNYYCCVSCANARKHSEETKNKIKESVKKFVKNYINKNNKIKLICKNCGKEFELPFNKRNQKCCSVSCSSILRKENNKEKTTKRIKIKKEKDLNKITFIYSLEYPVGNIRYIGKSDNPLIRLKNHLKEAKNRNKNHKDNWINSLPETPILNIIEQVTYANWQEKEIYWIKYYRENGCKLVNGTDGGEGSNGAKGMKHTEETKNKISLKRKGTVQSEERRLKTSGENSGRCKITDLEVKEIFKMYYIDKIHYKIIAEKYNLNAKYVFQIVTRKKRKDVIIDFDISSL